MNRQELKDRAAHLRKQHLAGGCHPDEPTAPPEGAIHHDSFVAGIEFYKACQAEANAQALATLAAACACIRGDSNETLVLDPSQYADAEAKVLGLSNISD